MGVFRELLCETYKKANITMKLISTLLFFLFAKVAVAQISILPIDTISYQVAFTEVINVDSATAKDLFSRGKLWFAKTYKSSNAVIQNIDNESFSITGKANMRAYAQFIGTRTWGYVNYTISIFCKDGRYKYLITDFSHEGDPFASASTLTPSVGPINKLTKDSGGFGSYRKKDFDKLCQEINSDMINLISSLKNDMNKKTETETKDW